jgi:hypothetical protein
MELGLRLLLVCKHCFYILSRDLAGEILWIGIVVSLDILVVFDARDKLLDAVWVCD